MRRRLKILLAAVAAPVLLIVAAIGVGVGTETGSRWLLNRAVALAPVVEIGSVQGRLARDLTLRDVRIHLATAEVTIARLALRWHGAGALLGHVDVEALGVSGVEYRATAAAPEPTEPAAGPLLPERVDLPVAITLQRLTVEDVELRLDPDADADAEPLIIDRVELAATFADSRLDVQTLAVDAPLGTLRGGMQLTTAGRYPLDGRLDWQFRPPDLAPLDGVTRLGGDLQALTIEQRIEAPYDVTLEGSVGGLLAGTALEIDAELAVVDLNPAALRQDLPDLTVNLRTNAQGQPDDLALTSNLDVTDAQGQRAEATLAARLESDALILETLTVRQPGQDATLNGAGTIALAGEQAADLTIRWADLHWPLSGPPMVATPAGTLTFQGPLDDYHLQLEARFEAPEQPPLDLRLRGDGDLQSVRLDLDADAADGSLTGQARLGWADAVTADIDLEGSGLDPSRFVAGWPGSVSLEVEAQTRIEDAATTVTVSTLRAGGRLRDQPLRVDVRGDARLEGDRLTAAVQSLEAALGDTRLAASGTVAERVDARWELSSDDLATVLPEAAGRLSGRGEVSGALPEVRVVAELEGDGLAYGEDRLEAMTLDADIDLSGARSSNLQATLQNASVGGQAIQQVVLAGTGTPGRHDLTLQADAEPASAALALSGGVEDPWGDAPVWTFSLGEGRLAYQPLAPWTLVDAAAGSVSADELAVEQQCWQSEDAELCFGAERRGGNLAADLSVEALAFAYFQPFLPGGMDIGGSVSGTGRAEIPSGAPPSAALELTTTAGEVRLQDFDETDEEAPVTQRVRFSESRVQAELTDSRARLEADLGVEEGRLQLDASLPAAAVTEAPPGDGAVGAANGSAAWQERPLDGEFRVDLPDLEFIAELVPSLDRLEGRLGGELALSGTLARPIIDGTVALDDGRAVVSEAGLDIKDIALALEGRGAAGAGLTLAAVSGGGEIRLVGAFSPIGDALRGELDVTGQRFLMIDTDEAEVYVSPDLHVVGTPERIDVTGTVTIPAAEITPGSQPPSAVAVSQDQVLLEPESDAPEEANQNLFAEVRLILGDEVRFEGFGLKGRIEGNVLAKEEPGTPTTATGELQILDGEYRAYGQGLVIENGRVFFAGGPVTEPGLDIRAVRRPKEGILVGAQVGGTLQQPTFELFSEPAMAQQEQLSYLVLGRSLAESSGGEGSALSQAALAMSLRGGDYLAKNIGNRLGFDQIGIETGSGEAGSESNTDNAALVVGKYLSPRLFVSYGIGLFDPETVLQMQYEISQRWKVMTQSGSEATGGDIMYSIERGD